MDCSSSSCAQPLSSETFSLLGQLPYMAQNPWEVFRLWLNCPVARNTHALLSCRRGRSRVHQQRRHFGRDAAGLSVIRRDRRGPELSVWEVCPPPTATMP